MGDMPLSFESALTIAERFLNENLHASVGDVVVRVEEVLETPRAWLFPYQTAAALAGDFHQSLAGNWPIWVDKTTGRVRYSIDEDYKDAVRHRAQAVSRSPYRLSLRCSAPT